MTAMAATLSPLAGEETRFAPPRTRGYVVNLVRSISPKSLELEIDNAAAAGFNLILFPVLSNGWTLYPSAAMRSYGLGRINPLLKGWNPLAEACRLAVERNLAVWAYGRPFNFHPRHSIAEHKLLHRYPEWRLRAHPDFYSSWTRRYEMWHPCPIHPDYRRHVADLLTEVVGSYPVDGLVLYYGNYGLHGGALKDSPYCFCESCREQYGAAFVGADIRLDALGEQQAQVRAWQMRMSHDTLTYLRHRLLRVRRGMRLICRARPHWRERPADGELQRSDVRLMNWPTLLKSGMVDELLIGPDDEPAGPMLGSRLAADYAYLGDQVLFAPIGVLDAAEDLAHLEDLVGRYPIPGYFAEFQHDLDREAVDLIRQRHFAEQTSVAESSPVRTAIWLLDKVRLRHPDTDPLGALMADMLRILTRQLPEPFDFNTLSVIEQNLAGLEQLIRRRRLSAAAVDEDTLRRLGLARRFVRMALLDVRA